MKIRGIVHKIQDSNVKKRVDKGAKTCYYKSEPRKTEKQGYRAQRRFYLSVNREKRNNPDSKTEKRYPSHKVTYLTEKGVIPLYNTEVTQMVSCFALDSVLR